MHLSSSPVLPLSFFFLAWNKKWATKSHGLGGDDFRAKEKRNDTHQHTHIAGGKKVQEQQEARWREESEEVLSLLDLLVHKYKY
jgi:hypothetical protein